MTFAYNNTDQSIFLQFCLNYTFDIYDYTKRIPVENNDEKLAKTLSNTQVITKNLSKLSDSLVNADFGKTIKNLETSISSLSTILANIEKGNGSMGKLMYDDQMYTNLTNASKELEELLREMKEHPKRFVHFSLFGKKEKGYQPTSEVKE